MSYALYTFGKDAEFFARMSTREVEYRQMCQTAPASSEESTIAGFQLRFLDNRSYVIEVICTLIEDTPLRVTEGRLPMYVEKIPGDSGFYTAAREPSVSRVGIKLLHVKRYITVQDGRVTRSSTAQTATHQPATICKGYGYRCCDVASLSGTGEARTEGVLDCPGSCYASCEEVPYFASFTVDPFPQEGRTVRLQSEQEQVVFSYTVGLEPSRLKTVTIDYGDGSSEEQTEVSGLFTHTYTCTDSCSYTVRIWAEDTRGKRSATTELTTFTIQR